MERFTKPEKGQQDGQERGATFGAAYKFRIAFEAL